MEWKDEGWGERREEMIDIVFQSGHREHVLQVSPPGTEDLLCSLCSERLYRCESIQAQSVLGVRYFLKKIPLVGQEEFSLEEGHLFCS